MINSILKGIFGIITKLISILLTPINLLISNFLPDINSALVSIRQFFNIVFSGVSYCLDSFMITRTTINFLIAFWTFKLTFPLLVYIFKLIVQWYNNLKV